MRALPKNLVLLINAVSQPIALMEDIGHSGFEIYVCYVTNVCMVVSNVYKVRSNFSELSGCTTYIVDESMASNDDGIQSQYHQR